MKEFNELLLDVEAVILGDASDIEVSPNELDSYINLLCDYYKTNNSELQELRQKIFEANRDAMIMRIRNERIKKELGLILSKSEDGIIKTRHWTVNQCLNHGSQSIKIMKAAKRRSGVRPIKGSRIK